MKMTATCTCINGQLVHESRDDLSRIFVLDPAGSVVATTDHEGRLIDQWIYWPYGAAQVFPDSSKAPEFTWGWDEPEPSRMKFDGDKKLVLAAFRTSATARSFITPSNLEDTEPWR